MALLASDARYLAAAEVPLADLAAAVSLDVHAYDAELALKLMRGSDVDANRVLIRHLFGATPAEQAAFSPATYIAEPDVPPSLLVSSGLSHAPTFKGFVAREASATHARRLKDAGHQAVHVHLDGSTHSGLVTGFGAIGHAATEAVEALLVERR